MRGPVSAPGLPAQTFGWQPYWLVTAFEVKGLFTSRRDQMGWG